MDPTFLFIGPDKTGSSWLYEILAAHPHVYVPAVKDIQFFDWYYDRGWDWYRSFFAEAPATALACGELSHNYLFSRDAAERIHRDLPSVRLLTCLREPVSRTLSHYLFMVRSGRTRMPFEEALDAFPELVHNSLYATHLAPYLERFTGDRLKVLLYDELVADPHGFARDVFDHLGVPFVDGLPYTKRVLPAARPRVYVVARAVWLGANLARRIGLTGLVGVLKRGALARLLYRPLDASERPEVAPHVRARLSDAFAPEIDRLETVLGLDLSTWRDHEDRRPAAVTGR